jgi:hypothetical protein
LRRPLLVTIISLFMILAGAGQILFGVVVLVNRNKASFLADTGRTSSELTALGVGMAIIGAMSILLAFGLLRGSRFVRALVGLFEVLQIAGGIWTLARLDSDHRCAGIGQIVGGLIVLCFLFGTDKAKAFFAR